MAPSGRPLSHSQSAARPLPHDYGNNFRHVLYDATLHRYAGHIVVATLPINSTETTDDSQTITGTNTDTTQELVDPATNDSNRENTLYVDTSRQTISVGAVGAFLEDYEATNVVLRDSD